MGVYIGMDVSKAWLDVAARPGGETWRLTNDEQGIDAVLTRLESMTPSLVVLEASGGYERSVVAALAATMLPVAVVNPRQIHDFAKATGKLAKTDRSDAQALAHFGEAVRPEMRPVPDEQAREFAAIMARRRQVVGMIVAERNRMETAVSSVRERIEAHIGFLEAELSDLDHGLDKVIRESPVWREKDELLRSVPGVGPKVSSTLLADLPELGMLDNKKLAALVGVAPLNRDSGVFRGKRRVWGGRTPVRQVLYMAAVTAARCNPIFREFYRRLVARRQAEEGSLSGVYAQATHHPQLDAQPRDPVGATCVKRCLTARPPTGFFPSANTSRLFGASMPVPVAATLCCAGWVLPTTSASSTVS